MLPLCFIYKITILLCHEQSYHFSFIMIVLKKKIQGLMFIIKPYHATCVSLQYSIVVIVTARIYYLSECSCLVIIQEIFYHKMSLKQRLIERKIYLWISLYILLSYSVMLDMLVKPIPANINAYFKSYKR